MGRSRRGPAPGEAKQEAPAAPGRIWATSVNIDGESAANAFCVLWLNPFPQHLENALLYGAGWEAELASHCKHSL